MLKNITITLISICILISCSTDLKLNTELENSVDSFKNSGIYTQDCNDLHTITKINAEYYIFLDSLKSQPFEKKFVDINGNQISLNHKRKDNFVNKDEFFKLLNSIKTIKNALLFVGYEVSEEMDDKKKMKFSQSCLNIYGAIIDGDQPRMVSENNFYIGSGCNKKNKKLVEKRDSLINSLQGDYSGFNPRFNKFGVVYNPKCLLETLEKDFEGDKVYIDFAFNPNPANLKSPHRVFVFSDDANLRSRAVVNPDFRKLKTYSQTQEMSKTYAPTNVYGDNGTACCPI